MSTRKIAQPIPRPCRDPEHAPPKYRSYTPGTYEHRCPSCGHKTVFTIEQVLYEHHGEAPKTWWSKKWTDNYA